MKETVLKKIELLKSWIATGQVVTQEGRNIDDLMTLVNQIELSSIGGEDKANLFEPHVCAMCKISLNAIVEKGEEKTLDKQDAFKFMRWADNLPGKYFDELEKELGLGYGAYIDPEILFGRWIELGKPEVNTEEDLGKR